MTLNIKVPSSLGDKIREAAKLAGMDIQEYAFMLLERQLGEKKNILSADEAVLFEQINHGFSEEEWNQYRLLTQKRDNEELSQSEYKSLLDMTDQLEKDNVNRIQALATLASMRGISLEEIMKEIGIESPGYE